MGPADDSSRHGAAAFEVVELDAWERVAPLRDEWDALLAESPDASLFLLHEWLDNWWAHFASGRRLAVLVARERGRLAAALPLIEERGAMFGRPIRLLRSMTNDHSFRFNALARRDGGPALAALWTYLRGRTRPWDVLRLEEIPHDRCTLEPFLAAARGDGAFVGASRQLDVPYLPIEGSWAEYHASLSKNMRANLRKKGRRLSEEGAVAFRSVRAREDVASVLQTGLVLESSGWKAQEGSAIVSDSNLTSFYSRWAEIAASRGWLRLSFLDVNGAPVAFDFSTLYGGCYYDLKMGYDPAWERFSVGQLLKARILEACFEDGVAEYDFLGASMRAKDDWMPRKRGHDWWFVFRRSLTGRALHFLKFTATPMAKRLRGH
ncbi:MAG TPA: GNAT family N-acetyltransferase [Candidatus Eisenbacteria bacterium]|nr:GNAT family N-acetyltransferase [Candidatus Eisenbacteria bacterium]